MSRMDDIYDRYIANEKLKNGTKYERIAAIVYKSLEQGNTVFHDLRLSGEGKQAKHQIDVVVEKQGEKKRILIECKDYDSVIGIDIIRDFHGAVHQIKPDEAIVITTKKFTSGARKFADDERIKLAVLREFESADWEGRIKRIHFHITTKEYEIKKFEFIYDDAETSKFQDALAGATNYHCSVDLKSELFYTSSGDASGTYHEVLEPIFDKLLEDEISGTYNFDELKYVKINGVLIGMRAFDYEFEVHTTEFSTISDIEAKVALLILEYLDGTENKIIFEEDISHWTFGEDGQVVEKKGISLKELPNNVQ